jgi:exodeoxyribonuclease V alpha subunit
MGEVVGLPAKTIHRLLVWNPHGGGFKKNEHDLLVGDVLIIDETSMLDIALTSSIVKAIPDSMQLIFIGDCDQLPSVGPGHVLRDLIDSQAVPCFQLTQVFRQASQSSIIRYAHQINKGTIPNISSPIQNPHIWNEQQDCLFIDSDMMSAEKAKFIQKAKKFLENIKQNEQHGLLIEKNQKQSSLKIVEYHSQHDEYSTQSIILKEDLLKDQEESQKQFHLSKKWQHLDINKLYQSQSDIEELLATMKNIHPWSSLLLGLNAIDVIKRLYVETIPKKWNPPPEIQILSPLTKGPLGTIVLNKMVQESINPHQSDKKEILVGSRIYREGDRVIQKRNNYELHVFNGDIGYIKHIDPMDFSLIVEYIQQGEKKQIHYTKEYLLELDHAYAITIHKSQGSEFDVVIIPMTSSHFVMLYRNLIYTAITRAKKFVIFVGQRKALSFAIKNTSQKKRQTYLMELLTNDR